MGAGAARPVNAIGDSLALLHTRHQLEAAASHQPQSAPTPTPTAAEIAADPTKLPPASAGSNGTTVPHSSSLSRQQIFAHSRGGSDSTAILLTGVALAPPDAPEAVKGAINAANTIVGRPYIWGGGHGSFYSTGYDCSGSVSFALHGGKFLESPLPSGPMEKWGLPGEGRWITVYANAGHAYAVIAGYRWDTSGDEGGETGPRWHSELRDNVGFIPRHPAGY